MDEAVVILQARMGSNRLPGKVLRDLGGTPMLTYTMRTLGGLKGVDRVVLATSELEQDDILEDLALKMGVPCLRGPHEDVLHRFALASRRWPARWYLRATGDNPLVEPSHPPYLLRALAQSGADYCGIRGLPVGGALEAFSAEALHRCDRLARTVPDREHVTLAMKQDGAHFRSIYLDAEEALNAPGFLLTVDTEEDFQRVAPWVLRFWDESSGHARWPEMVACWRKESGGQPVREEES